ncbi:MAG: YciI family protein [Acidiferrobacteraceae bacterium]
MRFVLLIIEPSGEREARNEAEGHALYDAMVQFGEHLAARGQLVASQSLRPGRHGVRVRWHEGTPQLRDGPFAEAREMVGGFYLIDCADRDEAIAIAQTCPAAHFASVEVRECAPCYVS